MDLQPVLDFLHGPVRNAYVTVFPFHLYLRAGYQMIDGWKVKTLCIANVSRLDSEKNWGHGEFRKFLKELNDFLLDNDDRGIEAVYIENVLNPRLAKSLLTMDFTTVPKPFIFGWADDPCPCFYRWVSV